MIILQIIADLNYSLHDLQPTSYHLKPDTRNELRVVELTSYELSRLIFESKTVNAI